LITIQEKALLKIAIVDDEAELGSLYSKVLRRMGYLALSVFEDGIAITEYIKRDRATFDVVLIDYQMPGMNGIEASKIILRERPQTQIILMTANGSVEERARSLGMHFIQKPFSLKEFEEIVKKAETSVIPAAGL
jgi:DNA-binding NtrC family response regulator